MKLMLASVLLFTLQANAATAPPGYSPIVYGSNNTAKLLQGNLNFHDVASILFGTADPTSVAQSAPQGSIYCRTGGSGGACYSKQDAGSTTNWTVLGGGGSGGVTTMAAVGSSPSANGASISGVTLTLQPADGTHPGVLTSGTQTIGGNKTMSGTLAMGSNAITGVADPSSAQDASTKAYTDAKVSDTAYNASSWDGVTTIAPSKNAVRDQIQTRGD